MTSAYSIYNQDPEWRRFPCNYCTARWRFLPDGSVEVEGEGVKTEPWPTAVDNWKNEIAAAAMHHGVPAAWIAAVMCIESAGRANSCLHIVKNDPNSPCNTAEGIGLMAITLGAANGKDGPGRPVTADELLHDNAFNVDLGTKIFRAKLDNSQCSGDFVKAAVSYNAGGVHCAPEDRSGSTFETKEPCPPTKWGVIMGCNLVPKTRSGSWCAESTKNPGKYKCPNLYPQKFIRLLNKALSLGWGDMPPSYEPLPVPPDALVDQGTPQEPSGSKRFFWFAAGGVAGYLGLLYLPRLTGRLRAAR